MTWWGEGRPAFFDPRGGTHFEGRWQPPQLPERALEAMIEENLRGVAESGPSASGRGAHDGATAGARWKREADIPDEIYFRALEAIVFMSPSTSGASSAWVGIAGSCVAVPGSPVWDPQPRWRRENPGWRLSSKEETER